MSDERLSTDSEHGTTHARCNSARCMRKRVAREGGRRECIVRSLCRLDRLKAAGSDISSNRAIRGRVARGGLVDISSAALLQDEGHGNCLARRLGLASAVRNRSESGLYARSDPEAMLRHRTRHDREPRSGFSDCIASSQQQRTTGISAVNTQHRGRNGLSRDRISR